MGGSPPSAMRFSTPALRKLTKMSASSRRLWPAQVRWAIGLRAVRRNMENTRSVVRWRDEGPPR